MAASTETTMRKEFVRKNDGLEALLKERDIKVDHPHKNASNLIKFKVFFKLLLFRA